MQNFNRSVILDLTRVTRLYPKSFIEGKPGFAKYGVGLLASEEAERQNAGPSISLHLSQHFCLYTGSFFHWYPPKKLKYGKPRLGEFTLT